MPVLLIVAGVVAALGVGITGWQIWKSTTLGVPIWVWIIGGGALLFAFLTSDTGKRATSAGISVGKMYITKGALKNPKKHRFTKQDECQLRKPRFFTCGSCGQKFLNLGQKERHERGCYE